MKVEKIKSIYELSAGIGGFYYVQFMHKNVKYSLQACLCEKKFGNCQNRMKAFESGQNIYEMKIDSNDSGMDWGICGDVNERAFTEIGRGWCERFLYKEAEKDGIEII